MIEPFSFYENEGKLRFFLVNCGSGLTHLIIFPDDTVMLFDCNLVEDEKHPQRSKSYILELFAKMIPRKKNKNQEIDIFVNSHRDTDHLRGLKDINERFPIKSIWDSGQSGANVENEDYKYYMRLRNCLKNKNQNNLVVPEPSNRVFRTYNGADVYVLSSTRDFVSAYELQPIEESADREQHTNCMVLLIHYAKRKILLTGDSDWKAWKENIVPKFKNASVNYENTDILIASHHGSRTFFTCENEIDENKHSDTTYIDSIKLIKPKLTLISCAEYEYSGYHLPNKDAMELYKENTSNAQVYTTNERGTFCGRIDLDGNFSVTPWRFRNTDKQIGKRIILKCKTETGEEIKNGVVHAVGCKLYFQINQLGDVLNTADDPIVRWEVCNAGEDDDDNHHEIYYKGSDEKEGLCCFTRDLSFVGTHLLCCKVQNKKKKFDQTIVFVIHGK